MALYNKQQYYLIGLLYYRDTKSCKKRRPWVIIH